MSTGDPPYHFYILHHEYGYRIPAVAFPCIGGRWGAHTDASWDRKYGDTPDSAVAELVAHRWGDTGEIRVEAVDRQLEFTRFTL